MDAIRYEVRATADASGPAPALATAPEKPAPRRSGEVVLGSARVEAEARRRADYLSPMDRKRAAAMAERVRGDAPDYMQDVGAGGELVPASILAENSRALEFRDTVQRPDYVAVDASRDRLELANAAGALEMGLDLADTIGAQNSLEKMLSHQLAATHRSVMKMHAQVSRRLDSLETMVPDRMQVDRLQALNVETCRMAGTVARMMQTFQQGMLTLERVRSQGRQTMIVQHQYVTRVEDGGQAVIAGEVKASWTNGRGSRKTKGERS